MVGRVYLPVSDYLSDEHKNALRHLKRRLDAAQYGAMLRALRGSAFFSSPLLSANRRDLFLERVRQLPKRAETILKLFAFGHPVTRPELVSALSSSVAELLTELEICGEVSGYIKPNRFVMATFDGLYYWANYQEESSSPDDFSVYIGDDSYRLAHELPHLDGGKVLDVGTGTGFFGIYAVGGRGAAHATGLDIQPRAVEFARLNATLNGVEDRTRFLVSDGFEALDDDDTFDLIVCNPPFVPCPDDEHLPLPTGGGERGLAFVERLLSTAPRFLEDDGRIMMVLDSFGGEDGPWLERLLQDFATAHNDRSVRIIMSTREVLGLDYFAPLATTSVLASGKGREAEPETAARFVQHYKSIDAEFVYPNTLVFVGPRGSSQPPNAVSEYRLYNAWEPEAVPAFGHDPQIGQRAQQYLLAGDGELITLSPAEAELLHRIDGSRSVDEIHREVQDLPPSLLGTRYPDFLQDFLDTCEKLQLKNLLKRKDP